MVGSLHGLAVGELERCGSILCPLLAASGRARSYPWKETRTSASAILGQHRTPAESMSVGRCRRPMIRFSPKAKAHNVDDGVGFLQLPAQHLDDAVVRREARLVVSEAALL
jgi:hypothetical protein